MVDLKKAAEQIETYLATAPLAAGNAMHGHAPDLCLCCLLPTTGGTGR